MKINAAFYFWQGYLLLDEVFFVNRFLILAWLELPLVASKPVMLPHGSYAYRLKASCTLAARFSWWRAPEVFINWERYDEKVDIWSVGCIMAELIILKPLFAGTDHIDQLTKIFDIVGTPALTTLDEVCEPCKYQHQCCHWMSDVPRRCARLHQ